MPTFTYSVSHKYCQQILNNTSWVFMGNDYQHVFLYVWCKVFVYIVTLLTHICKNIFNPAAPLAGQAVTAEQAGLAC